MSTGSLNDYVNVDSTIPEPSGSFPYGIYDDVPIYIDDAKKSAKWMAYRLGAPIMQIELSWYQLFSCYEEAVMEYSSIINDQKSIDVLSQLINTSVTGSADILNTSAPVQSMEFYEKLTDWISTNAGAGGSYNWYQTYINVTSSIQDYNLNELIESGSRIEVKEIYHERLSSTLRALYGYGNSLQSQFTLNSAIKENAAVSTQGTRYLMLPAREIILKSNAIELLDKLRRSQYGYEIVNNHLRIFPVPDEDFRLYLRYRKNFDPVNTDRAGDISDNNIINDISKIPTGYHDYTKLNSPAKTWIKKYAYAVAMETMGYIRSKFDTVPIPDNEVGLNGDSLISAGQEAKAELVEELKRILEETSYSRMLEKQADMDESIQRKFSSSPMLIYIK